ncbi:MAG: hypothetical protein HY235_14230 [Acidobacteria bacterium]|nr:hypothetical protein [Acidobacteriota bacterium]
MALSRRIAGIAVLVALVFFCVPPEVLAAAVAERAARLGLRLTADQVRVYRSDAGAYIEGRYAVRVDLFVYTVDLHFRPAAGAR